MNSFLECRVTGRPQDDLDLITAKPIIEHLVYEGLRKEERQHNRRMRVKMNLTLKENEKRKVQFLVSLLTASLPVTVMSSCESYCRMTKAEEGKRLQNICCES